MSQSLATDFLRSLVLQVLILIFLLSCH